MRGGNEDGQFSPFDQHQLFQIRCFLDGGRFACGYPVEDIGFLRVRVPTDHSKADEYQKMCSHFGEMQKVQHVIARFLDGR